MKVGAVVLAAGLSSRMPVNKLLLPLNGKTVIECVLETLLKSELDEVVVVTGKDRSDMDSILDLYDVRCVHNPNFNKGQSTSVIAGIKALSHNLEGVFFVMGDQPLIKQEIINGMINQFKASESTILVPKSDRGQGSPVLFGSKWFPALLQVKGDKGGREIIRQHPDQVAYYQIPDQNFFIDIDTESAYDLVRSILDQRKSEKTAT